MADDDNTGLLILGGVGLYLFATGKLSGLFGPTGNKSASGVPLKRPAASQEDRIASDVAGGLCAIGGTLAAGPIGGKAAGGYCASVGAEAWKGAKWAASNPVVTARSLLGFGSGKPQATYAQTQKWYADLTAKGGTPPTGCGGWKGPCPPVQTTEAPIPPAPAPPQFMGPTFKPMGFR